MLIHGLSFFCYCYRLIKASMIDYMKTYNIKYPIYWVKINLYSNAMFNSIYKEIK